MSVINALLITSSQDELPVIQYFPLNYEDKKSITELLTISKYFKNCGKGFLQHNNKLFYYKTYIPNLPGLRDNNSNKSNNSGLSQSFSDYFIYSLDCNKKKFFFLYFCELNCEKKIIDDLTNEIFDIFDKGAFDEHKLKISAINEINNIFEKYQKISSNFEVGYAFNNINNDQINYRKKRLDSRMIIPKMKKTKTSGEISKDIEDFTSIKDTNTNFSLMFRYNIIDENSFIYKNKDYKKIKIWNIIICSILLLASIGIFIIIIL
jgi:hypothetical protein